MQDWQALAELEDKLDAMGKTPYDREAYEFALEVLECAPSYYEGLPTAPLYHPVSYNLTAGDFAYCYLLHAKEVFEQPLATLTAWGLRSSLDIGQVVFALVQAGLIERREEDRLEQFEGLFEIAAVLGRDGG